jgi:hypothetical protein
MNGAMTEGAVVVTGTLQHSLMRNCRRSSGLVKNKAHHLGSNLALPFLKVV